MTEPGQRGYGAWIVVHVSFELHAVACCAAMHEGFDLPVDPLAERGVHLGGSDNGLLGVCGAVHTISFP